MKILVIGDTHGDIDGAEVVIKENMDVDLVIHLGDYYRDAEDLASLFPELSFEYIYGNSDFMTGSVPAEKCLDIEGKRIYLTHGHRYSVKWDSSRLEEKAVEVKADILLFGHTHIPCIIEKNGYCLVNPGSTSVPRGGSDESYAIIEINSGEAGIRIYTYSVLTKAAHTLYNMQV